MKIVINKCYGGFTLSPLAVQRLAELNGKPCYFFKCIDVNYSIYKEISLEKANKEFFIQYFTIPNPPQRLKTWFEMTSEEQTEWNAQYYEINLTDRPENRTDPKLIQVVEELGSEKASGRCAELAVVEIPNDVDWEIEEYDGTEWIAEKHRTWG